MAMTPDQIDELAQALYGAFCTHGRFENTFHATQELYRNGVRVVLERAGKMGDVGLALLRDERDVARVECKRNWERAEAAEKERDDAIKRHEEQLRRDGEFIESIAKERDEQKARADSLESALTACSRLAAGVTTETLEADLAKEKARAGRAAADAVQWMGKHAYADARCAALEKAVEAADYLHDRHLWLFRQAFPTNGGLPESAVKYAAARAALDAPQPNQDSSSLPNPGQELDPVWPRAEGDSGHPIPDGILIAAAVYECTVMAQQEGGLPKALNASGQFAGLDYGLDLNERMRARKEARRERTYLCLYEGCERTVNIPRSCCPEHEDEDEDGPVSE